MRKSAPGKQDDAADAGDARHPDAPQPLEAFENETNPRTGEIGGPRGEEPTRFGDWERKGRVFDF